MSEEEPQEPREYVRFLMDLAIPKSDWTALSSGQRSKICNDILDIKNKSKEVKNSADTVKAKWHICRHEFGDSSCVEEDVTETSPAQMQMEEEEE